jgi:hypothetical protein
MSESYTLLNNVLRKSFLANGVEGTTLSGVAAQKFTAISSHVLGHFRAFKHCVRGTPLEGSRRVDTEAEAAEAAE